MKITFSEFKGTAPKLDPEQLADGYAATAINTRTGRGILEAFRSPKLLTSFTLNGVKSVAQYLGQWFSWGKTTYMEPAPLANDPWDYAVIAADGEDPKVTYNTIAIAGAGPYPSVTYPLGVPVPPKPVSVTVSVADNWHTDTATGGVMPDYEISEDEYDDSTTSYVLVYVDAWGRLSAPSDPSDLVNIREWENYNTNKITVTLPSAPADLIVSDATRGSVAKVRLYRANYSLSGEGVYQFVGETAITATTFDDQLHSSELNEGLISENWARPPNTDTSLYPNGTMEKVVTVGADMLAGHNKRLVCYAEPNVYYAWPVEYYKVIPHDIVTIQATTSSLVVLTSMYPYVLQGSHPSAVEPVRLSDPVPCASKLAVAEIADSVYFASHTGLYRVNGFSITNVSNAYFTEEQWKNLDPSTMSFAVYEGELFISCPTVGFTYVFNPRSPDFGIRRVDFAPSTFSLVESSNDLAFVDETDNNLYLFDADTNYLPVAWSSKVYAFNDPTCFNVIRVKANLYPVNVVVRMLSVAGDWREINVTAPSASFRYLPVLGLGTKFQILITSYAGSKSLEVRSVQIAHGIEELD